VKRLGEAGEARDLVRRCLSGDREAVQKFQEQYGELIYGYPTRVYGTAAEQAADFYVYAFDKERIFHRLRTFSGRAPLRAYLLGYVLDHLAIDWQRAAREVDTLPMDTINGFADRQCLVSESATAAAPTASAREPLRQALAAMAPAKAVIIKLLYIEDYDLAPSDIQYLAQASRRRVKDVLAAVAHLRATVREREASLKRIEDSLDAVQAWIQLYERRLQRVDEELRGLGHGNASSPVYAQRLAEERAELERKIRRRQEQRRGLLDRAQRRKITTPYKDIAALLNTSSGNVASLIARARRELMQRLNRPTARALEHADDGT
jgi:RNA polymerase sigma factor (sigma-70 family)